MLRLRPNDTIPPLTIMTTTLDRSLSRASSMSISVSSPLLSVHRDITPPAVSDAGVAHLHDRLNYLDSRISELRSVILTKDNYVERRNREDLYIRREFETQRNISERIDVGVTILKTELNQIRNSVSSLNGDTVFLRNDVARLQKNLQQLQVDTAFLRNDVTRLQKNVQQIQLELVALKSEVGGCRTEIKQLHTAVNQSERVRFNSLATTIHAPINAVPKIVEDGTLQYPDYFPRTVWRFWCLKKRSRGEFIREPRVGAISDPFFFLSDKFIVWWNWPSFMKLKDTSIGGDITRTTSLGTMTTTIPVITVIDPTILVVPRPHISIPKHATKLLQQPWG